MVTFPCTSQLGRLLKVGLDPPTPFSKFLEVHIAMLQVLQEAKFDNNYPPTWWCNSRLSPLNNARNRNASN